MGKSINPQRGRKAAKPAKPYADFPLFAHATRRWAKKIRGRLYYFGPFEQRDDLYIGSTPCRRSDAGLELRDRLNRFVNSNQRLLKAGELSPRTFQG